MFPTQRGDVLGADAAAAAERMRANPRMTSWLNKIAGSMLVAFGVKLAVGK